MLTRNHKYAVMTILLEAPDLILDNKIKVFY